MNLFIDLGGMLLLHSWMLLLLFEITPNEGRVGEFLRVNNDVQVTQSSETGLPFTLVGDVSLVAVDDGDFRTQTFCMLHSAHHAFFSTFSLYSTLGCSCQVAVTSDTGCRKLCKYTIHNLCRK